MEDLHGRFQVVVGERHHVGVGAVAEHHGLLLHGPLHGGDVVPQPGSPLEVQQFGGLVHLLFHVTDQPVGLAGEEVAEVLDDLPVFVCGHPPHARSRAFVDVPE